MPSGNDYSTWSDAAIIEALRAQDNEVWDYVLRCYVNPALRFFKNRNQMNSYSIANDEVYYILWEKLSGIDKQTNEAHLSLFDAKKSNFKKWMYKQVRNTIGSIRKWKTAKKRTFDRHAPDAPPIEVLPDRNVKIGSLEEKENRAFLQKCFSLLWDKNPRRAYVLLLCTQFSFTQAEIAKILGTDDNSVKQFYHNAKKQFLEIMQVEERTV